AFTFDTPESLSEMSPKRIACVGHAAWQAVTISPSRIRRSCLSASMCAVSMRWMQYVHFSITPRRRTVTSGLRIAMYCGVCLSAYCMKLNRRTLYGQLLEQNRVPTQRLYTCTFRPSESCTVASTGQTSSHGACSHIMHGTGWLNIVGV